MQREIKRMDVEGTLEGMLQSDRDNTSALDDSDCQCMLCDSPAGHADMPVEWSVTIRWVGKVTWVHDGARDVGVMRIHPVSGPDFDESTMLLCDHCKEDWLDQQATGSRGRDLYVVRACTKIT